MRLHTVAPACRMPPARCTLPDTNWRALDVRAGQQAARVRGKVQDSSTAPAGCRRSQGSRARPGRGPRAAPRRAVRRDSGPTGAPAPQPGP